MWFFLALACQSELALPDAATADRHAMVNGTETTGDPAVVALARRPTTCGEVADDVFCTGTLVGSHHVLTAAHCLDSVYADRSVVVLFGPEPGPDVPTALVTAYEPHPAFDEVSRDHDVAMLLLGEAAPVAPFPLPTGSVDDLAPAAPLRAVGYGSTARDADDPGVKREGTLTLDVVRPGTFDALPAPSMTCVGDSGGPVFGEIDGAEQLIGLTSSGDFGCEALAVNARVEPSLDFVLAFLERDPIDPWPADAIPLDAVCDERCDVDEDCPAGMACPLGLCVLPGGVPAGFGASCTTEAECDGACAELVPGDCRCQEPCQPDLIPPDDDTGPTDTGQPAERSCGCATSQGPGWVWLLPLLAFGPRRQRAHSTSSE